MNTVPCKNCTNRHLGCQNINTCKDYKKFREYIDNIRNNRIEFEKKHGYINAEGLPYSSHYKK